MIQHLQIDELYALNKDQYNLNGLAYGYKIKNNVKTQDKALIYFVPEKKTTTQLTSNQIIPRTIEVNGNTYITDVIETKNIGPLVSNCGQYADSSSDDHRFLTRPLKGGISIGPFQPLDGNSLPDSASAGTLGGLVIDKEDGTISFLTNNHVVVADAFINSDKDPDILLNYNIKNRKVTQPGSLDNDFSADNKDFIGHVKRYYPLSASGVNYVDAALISTDARFVNIHESFKMLGLENATPLPFASSDEIDRLLVDNITLYKSGRSTGLNSTDTSPCRLSVVATGGALSINYLMQNANYKTVAFSDCMIAAYDDLRPFPAGPGDSGSFVIGNFNGILKIVGLLFAGDTSSFQWFAFNRIDRVKNLFHIDAWRGDSWKFTDQKLWTYFIKPGLSSHRTITESNKKYWQIGVDAIQVNDTVTLNSLYVNYDPSLMIDSCLEYDRCSGKPLGYNSKLTCN